MMEATDHGRRDDLAPVTGREKAGHDDRPDERTEAEAEIIGPTRIGVDQAREQGRDEEQGDESRGPHRWSTLPETCRARALATLA